MKLNARIIAAIVILSISPAAFNRTYAYGYNKTAEEYDKIVK